MTLNWTPSFGVTASLSSIKFLIGFFLVISLKDSKFCYQIEDGDFLNNILLLARPVDIRVHKERL